MTSNESIKICVYSICLATILSACQAGSGVGLNGNGQPDAATNSPTTSVTPTPTPDTSSNITLAQIQEEIFTPICTACHVGSSAPLGLRLDSEENSFNFLVNIESDQIPGSVRVLPNDPDNSYLIQKIEGSQGIAGSQMPLGGTPLTANQIQMIRDWILQGAQSSSNTSTKVQSISVNKNQDEIELAINFNRQIDSNISTEYPLEISTRSGEKTTLLSPDEYTLSYSQNSLKVELINVDAQGITVSINNENSMPLYDANGFIIDGNRNEQEGGEYIHEITF